MALSVKDCYFITGTNTGVGKTHYALTLLQFLNQQGLRTAAYKPIAAGCRRTKAGLRNADAIQLQAAMSLDLPYEIVNPFPLAQPIAPHIAAENSAEVITVADVYRGFEKICDYAPDTIIIEGAGGWLVPLNHRESFADIATAIDCSVILVVGITLGCINHALLTYLALKQAKVPMAGWVANCYDLEMPYITENIRTLQARLEIPLLEQLAFCH